MKQQIQHNTEAAVEQWRDRGKSKDYLLVGRLLEDAKPFQKQEAENLTLSNLASDFTQKSIQQRRNLIRKSIQQRRNNPLKLINCGCISLVVLGIFLGVFGERHIKIKQYWDTVEAPTGQSESPARISALQKPVELGVSLVNLPLSRANLSHAKSSSTKPSSTKSSSTKPSSTKSSSTKSSSTKPSSTKSSSAKLSSAKLSGADLSNAKLTGANLIGANLSNTKLIGADLSNAKLTGANLIGANLSNAKLKSSKNKK